MDMDIDWLSPLAELSYNPVSGGRCWQTQSQANGSTSARQQLQAKKGFLKAGFVTSQIVYIFLESTCLA